MTINAARLLERARQLGGMSQRELASRGGTAQSVVARIELGLTNPTFGTLMKLLRAAGCEVVTELRRRPVVDSSELDDVPRILRLTAEERLLEVAQVSRFMANVHRA